MDEILQPSIVNRYIISEHDSPLYSCNGHRARDVDYFFFVWSINLFYFSELFDVLCKKRPYRRICLLRKVLMTRLNLFHFLFNQRPLLVSQLMTNKERAQL